MEWFNQGFGASGGLVWILRFSGQFLCKVFVVVLGSCRVRKGKLLGGLGRWELSEWDGEVWEISGGYDGGLAMKKVVLVEFWG